MSSTSNTIKMNAVQIQCCLCGTMIYPNGANQCSSCLAQQVDLRSVLQKGPSGGDIVIHQCRQCRRFQRTEKSYVDVELESPELMTICLKHIPALSSSNNSGMQLMDAIWVWTEPNSMRMKVRLTVRTEISSVRIQQRCVVELIVKFQQCPDCNREYTNRTWHALVQLRQRRDQDASKTGLTVLEMALARNPAIRKHVLSMDTTKQGFDFYFLSLAHAQQFSSYLARVAPLKLKTTQKLVSADVKNNTANVKYTVAADMVPLCRDDLLLVHKSVRSNSGSLSLVTKMSSVVHLVDASPKRNAFMQNATGEVAPETYYKNGADKMYMILASARRLTRFVVLDIELCREDGHKQHDNNETPRLYQGPQSGIDKYALADVEVVRESDFGQNDETLQCVTHLGHLLQPGDVVLGYDLATFVVSGSSEFEMEQWLPHSFTMPDVVLVKKVQGGAVAADAQEEEAPKKVAAKSSRAKKRAKRQQREEKKMRALEDAAERMGFMEANNSNDNNFEDELTNDPDLAEELRAAEQELAKQEENVPQDEETLHRDTEGVVVSEP